VKKELQFKQQETRRRAVVYTLSIEPLYLVSGSAGTTDRL